MGNKLTIKSNPDNALSTTPTDADNSDEILDKQRKMMRFSEEWWLH